MPDLTITSSGVVEGDVNLVVGQFYKAVDTESNALALSPATFVLPDTHYSFLVKTEFSDDTATSTLVIFEGHEQEDGSFIWSLANVTYLEESNPDATNLITETSYRHGNQYTLSLTGSRKFRIAHTAPSAGSVSVWLKPI